MPSASATTGSPRRSARLSLERLCERIVAEHDYDLAVLARWDGRRRYANLRKLARLARSYEELRGPDVEGFVRFVRDQEAVGARELEAVAEEEGGDAVRLLTIHAAKGLEFKVVVVADAGRDRAPPSSHEILALSDGRFGFRVADPITSKPRGAYAYDAVQEARKEEERAERLRLYYVAMTRAIDRLIISGSIDPSGRPTRRRRSAGCSAASMRRRRSRRRRRAGGARARRRARDPARRPLAPRRRRRSIVEVAAEDGQLALFDDGGAGRACPRCVPALPPLAEVPAPPVHRVRRLSFSALALFDRCSYRYYAERVVGHAADRRARSRPGGTAGLAATEIGDAVHRLLELVNLRAAAAARRSRRPRARLVSERVATRSWSESTGSSAPTASRSSRGASRRCRVRGRSGRSRSSTTACFCTAASTCSSSTASSAVVVDYKTNSLAEGTPEEIVENDYRLQRLVYALACFRAGAREVEVVYHFLERSDAVVSTDVPHRADLRARGGAERGDRKDQRGRVPPDAERVHLRRLPGARRRLRRARACAAAGYARARTRYGLSSAEKLRQGGAPPRRSEACPHPRDHRPARRRPPGCDDRAQIRSPLELLVAVMLSAQTTDVNVNRVTEKLFVKYRKPEDYLAVPPEELERDIFATGFFRQKAKAMRGTMAMLLDRVRR